MHEIMLAEIRYREFQAEAAQFRLTEEAYSSDGQGLPMVEAGRRSLRAMLTCAQDFLADLERGLFAMRRSVQPR